MKYLAAITELGKAYPDFINFSENEDGSMVEIIARASNQTFQMTLPKVLIELFSADLAKNLK
jgi:hypothetical protein